MSPTSVKYESIWSRVLELVKQDIDSVMFTQFVLDTTLVNLEDGRAYVITKTDIQVALLSTHYPSVFNKAIQTVTETNYSVLFLTNESYITNVKVEEKKENPFASVSFSTNLNEDKTFDNFIVGPANNESFNASIAVANHPGNAFNPLFIWGDTGLGKTHLLNAIGNKVQQAGFQKIKLMTSKEFLDNYLKAINTNTVFEFESTLMNLDLLLVDDIQFFAAKHQTGDTFFNIFNNLIQNRKQVVITSDKHPEELRGLEERLVSRFKSGMTTTISCPTVELAKVIIDSKIKSMNFDPNITFTEEALFYIAENNHTDVRGIEGALTKIMFNLCLFKTDIIDINFVIQIFKDDNKNSNRKINATKIKNEVAAYFSIDAKKLEGNSRVQKIATARHISIYLIRKYTSLSFPMIGQEFGGRHHSTIISSVEKIENELQNDELTIKTISNLKNRLGIV